MVRGASLGRGAGWGVLSGAVSGPTSGSGSPGFVSGVPGVPCGTRRRRGVAVSVTPRASLGLHLVTAELVPERRQDLRSVAVVLARPEAGQQRERDDRRRDVVVDRLLDRPSALARVGDVAPEMLQVLAVRSERP